LKFGAQLRISVRRVRIVFSESFPAQAIFLQALRNLQQVPIRAAPASPQLPAFNTIRGIDGAASWRRRPAIAESRNQRPHRVLACPLRTDFCSFSARN
jgi:hypothetical protein